MSSRCQRECRAFESPHPLLNRVQKGKALTGLELFRGCACLKQTCVLRCSTGYVASRFDSENRYSASNRLNPLLAVHRTDSHNLAPLRGLCFYWGLYFDHAPRKRSHCFAPFRAGLGYSFGSNHPCLLRGILAVFCGECVVLQFVHNAQ